MNEILRVNEIFESISGEAGFIPQGAWTTFIRLQGCNLRCSWCDTPKAQSRIDGKEMSIQEIFDKVKTKNVLITGGEPLLQMNPLEKLVTWLYVEKGCTVQIETNGSFPLPDWEEVFWVVDYKGPSAGEETNLMRSFYPGGNIRKLIQANAIVKFVIKNTFDFENAVRMMKELLIRGYRYNFILSPIHPEDVYSPRITQLSSEIKNCHPELLDRIIFSLQLHKIIGMP